MKLTYLGTGAAEGVPSLFCQCDNCKKSRALGGRNIRSRSQALINDELLIDFPADTYWHFITYNFDCEKICGCIITHSHPDHLYPAEVEIAKPSLSNKHSVAKFYAAQQGYDLLMTQVPCTKGQAEATLVESGKRFEIVGKHKYSIMPMRANHDPKSTPVIYSIECEGKRMLYAHDSGYFFEDTWELLAKEGHFDLVSIDCTHCTKQTIDKTANHQSFNVNLQVLDRMREQGNIDDKTILIVNHFSHNGGATYDDMCKESEKHGIITSYDGMTVEF
ncbi:MAG: hypothetical protein K2M64_03295 [Clostridia bacterium]|nr:hypothetical protein [Clostridia bacterium]